MSRLERVLVAPNAAPAVRPSAPAAPHPKGKGKGRSKDKGGTPAPKGQGGKGRDTTPTPRSDISLIRPCFEFSKGRCTKAARCPFAHRKLTPEERVKRDEWYKAKPTDVSGGGSSRARNSGAACAAFIRGNCNKGNRCQFEHLDLGVRQSVPSAPASSSSSGQGSAQVAAGPAVIDVGQSGFANSILRRSAPAFTPARSCDN